MIPGGNRRDALAFLALGFGLACVPRTLRAAALARPFAPPEGPMLFTRKVIREMSHQARLVVERGFEIRFARTADGFDVTGEQVSIKVDVPTDLEPYAALERQRIDHGMFPLKLDPRGVIVAGPEGSSSPEFDKMVDLALADIRNALPNEAEQQSAIGFILALQQAAAQIGIEVPHDLFVPPAEEQLVIREVPLASGITGTLEARYCGRTNPATGLMAKACRRILTRVEGTERHSSEDWTLEPLG